MRSLLAVLTFLLATGLPAQQEFVRTDGARFLRGDEPYYFLGANFWYGMHLASDLTGGDLDRLRAELDTLQAMGINNLRIMLTAEGPDDAPYRVQPSLQPEPGRYEEQLLVGMDRLLVELAARDMQAVLCLNNFFQWSGGMSQYVSWATDTPIPLPHLEGHDWNEFQEYSALFFSNRRAKRYFKRFVRDMLQRENSLTGLAYTDDPTIMAWQLANEPRGFSQADAYVKWVDDIAGFIQRKAPKQLVSLGGEGLLPHEDTGTRFAEVSRSPHLDYLTMHLWVENWSWYRPQEPATYEEAMRRAKAYLDQHLPVAAEVNKPLVLEEFGMSRNGGTYQPDGATDYRDRYFTEIFEYLYQSAKTGRGLVGANFWSWSGQGIPPRPEEMWQLGDPLTGDPPHELQGWYSIYNTDFSTLAIIRRYVALMNQLGERDDMADRRKD